MAGLSLRLRASPRGPSLPAHPRNCAPTRTKRTGLRNATPGPAQTGKIPHSRHRRRPKNATGGALSDFCRGSGLVDLAVRSGSHNRPSRRRRGNWHCRLKKIPQKHFRAGIMPQPPEHQRSPQVQPPRAAYAGRLCHCPPHSPAPACRRGQRDRPPRSNQTPERRGGPPTSRANVAGGEKGNDGRCDETGFNPLAGIRSFLTKSAANRQNIVRYCPSQGRNPARLIPRRNCCRRVGQ